MGIPYYFTYLIQNHKYIIEKLKNINNIHNLYLDCNSIIYDSIDFKKYENNTQFEDLIIKNVINNIHNIINDVKPLNNVYIAIDGVPPFAKIKQQKNRRYKNYIQNLILHKNILWDSSSITPGTNFMNKLNMHITKYFNNNINNINIILNLSDIEGEGEQKIFHYIRNHLHFGYNTIIYGMDADLIMLSLNHLKYTNSLFLYRETPHFINSINKNLQPNEKYIININEFANQIYRELTNDISIQNDTPDWLKEASIILDSSLNELNLKNDKFYCKITDYIFICFLLGNDFLPHFPALNIRNNGFIILLELYKKLFGSNKELIKNNKIIWNNFKLFIQKIAENEEQFIKDNYILKEKYSKKYYPDNTLEEKELKLISIPTWERNIENYINPYEKYWEYRYYYSLFNVDIDKNKEEISNICKNYIETLLWTFKYYNEDCNNWIHYYKYEYPPLLIDLYKNIPYFESEIILNEDKTILKPITLLSYVLPQNSLNLLPNNIEKYLLENYKEQYRNDFPIIYAFCKYFWEGHVLFPNLDLDSFFKNINLLL